MAMDEKFWPNCKVYNYTFNFIAMSCLLQLIVLWHLFKTTRLFLVKCVHNNYKWVANLVVAFQISSNECFIGFPNFYRHFIAHYSTIVVPFTHLIWKDQPFSLGVKAKNAFQFLKVFFTTPFLIHADPMKPFVLKTNASNFALGVYFHNMEKIIFFITSASILVSFLLPN